MRRAAGAAAARGVASPWWRASWHWYADEWLRAAGLQVGGGRAGEPMPEVVEGPGGVRWYGMRAWCRRAGRDLPEWARAELLAGGEQEGGMA
jgi:hypothetical protein